MPLVELNAAYEDLDEFIQEFDAFAEPIWVNAGRWTITCGSLVVHAILPGFKVPFVDAKTREMVRSVLEQALLQALDSK